MNIKNKDFIFSEFGVSGREDRVREAIIKFAGKSADEIIRDRNGSLILLKKGSRKEGKKKIMLSAHYDSIGFIATYITPEGMVRFADVGYQPGTHILGKRVMFENGIIGTVQTDNQEALKNHDKSKYFIDIGAKDEKQAKSMISVGDMAAVHSPYVIQGDSIIGGWMDDRIGCFILLETLENLKSNPHDVYFVFSSQEEVGIRGAKTAAYMIDPDIGIAFDVTGTDDLPEKSNHSTSILGKGAAVKIKDNSVICHRGLIDYLESLAEKNKIMHQKDILTMGGTDAGAIQLTKSGSIAGGISIPTRYIHSANEMCYLSDVQACIDLSVAFCSSEANF